MNRRGFLGSVIGSVFSLPFFARLETEEWQRVVLPYRMLFRDSQTGFTIQAPGVAKILTSVNSCTWVAEPLYATTFMIVDRTVLLTEQGRVIKESVFHDRVYMCNGDTLNVQQSITYNTNNELTPEEIVKHIFNGAKFNQ